MLRKGGGEGLMVSAEAKGGRVCEGVGASSRVGTGSCGHIIKKLVAMTPF
jgi:hypothetical protein